MVKPTGTFFADVPINSAIHFLIPHNSCVILFGTVQQYSLDKETITFLVY